MLLRHLDDASEEDTLLFYDSSREDARKTCFILQARPLF
jgi:hypothetical protein